MWRARAYRRPGPRTGIKGGRGDLLTVLRGYETKHAGTPPTLHGARLAFREGLTRDAWEKLTPAQRDGFGNVGQSIWPDEPALEGMDDVTPNWMDRIKATGNCVVPLIPELIGRAILSHAARHESSAA